MHGAILIGVMHEDFSKEYLRTISNLYPTLDEDQVKEAAHNLACYTELILRIYERIRMDPEAYARFKHSANCTSILLTDNRSLPEITLM